METLTIKAPERRRPEKSKASKMAHEEDLLKQIPDLGLDKIIQKKLYTYQQYQELMETKKARHAKDHENARLFFAIGLVVSLLLVILAFEWKTYDNGEAITLQDVDIKNFEEIIDIPNTIQPPPPPPSVMAPIFKEVQDEVIIETMKVTIDVEMNENTVVENVVYEVPLEAPNEEKVDEIFSIVEQKPEPVGGMVKFYEYVAANIEYPAQARRMSIQGKVYVRFVVEKDGRITDVEVLKGIGGGCDEEAIRVLSNAPKWIPGKQRGRAVRVYMSVPIIFTLM